MLNTMPLAFGRKAGPTNPDEPISRETMRRIVASHSHGNVRLQAGRYTTREDVDAEFEALRGSDLTAA